MFKLINQTIVALFMGVFILIMSGCEVSGNEESVQPQFSYEIYDEKGELLKKVTHERVGDVEMERSFGLFGDHFAPPTFAEKIGRDWEDLRQHEIYLHVEKGVGEDLHFVTLRFSFNKMEEWKSGVYGVSTFLSKEEWLDRVRNMWERQQDFRQVQYQEYANQNLLPNTNLLEMEEQAMSVHYDERGFGIKRYIYLSTGGYLELENVSDDRLKGNFSVDLAALPADILLADEFPEDPEFRTFRITGTFVTEYGDFYDLKGAQIISWTYSD